MMTADILIVDDEADIRDLLSGLLEDEGYTTRQAVNGIQALEQVESQCPHLVVLDIWLEGSGLDGMEVLSSLKKDHPDLPIVMMSGHGTVETAVEAIKLGAYDFIEKPFDSDRILMTVGRAFETGRLRRELADLRNRLSSDHAVGLICHSQSMRGVSSAIERVAPSDSRVMITGPAGSGKEVVARRIHALSPRADGPFVILNCATLHPDKLEEELFGLESAGEPTRPGLLEQADGGTLLLDEVTDMPLESQGKIMRILQDQSFLRIGGTVTLTIDVRILSSSNKSVQAEIKAGRFREDMFFHLSVVPIDVPGLADRAEDIPDMVAQFMTASSRSGGRRPRPLSDDAYAVLKSYQWPGNVRQLKNVVDWISIMVPGDPDDPIQADMLPPEITAHTRKTTHVSVYNEYSDLGLRQAREAFERQYLINQMDRFDGNITKTAAFVGMERSALHRKLKSLGLWLSHGKRSKTDSPDSDPSDDDGSDSLATKTFSEKTATFSGSFQTGKVS